MQFKKIAAGLVGAALIAGGMAFAVPATADTTPYVSWTEDDDPAPLATIGGLVFYKGASVNLGNQDRSALVRLAEVDGLAYTVDDSTGYAPSYQLGIVNRTTKVTYARLVWEPYQQTTSPGDDQGSYADLEDGLWWGANVWQDGEKSNPFGSGEGSQSRPATLEFFEEHFGAGAEVAFFGIKQGSTTNVVSTVSSLTFDGRRVPLGSEDSTPYDARDVAAKVAEATSPLQTQLTKLKDEKAATDKQNAALRAELATYKKSVDATNAALIVADNAAKTAQAKLVSISGTPKVGKTVKVKFDTAIRGASVKYQWYVNGKKVSKATKSSLKLARSHAYDSLWVKVTTSWTDAQGKKHSVTATAKYLRTAYVKR